MTFYRKAWTRFWAAVVVACLALAGVVWGPGRALAFFVVVAISTLAPAICYHRERIRHDKPGELWKATVRVAAVSGAVGVAVVASISVAGPLAVLTLFVAAASSPWVVGGMRRVYTRQPDGPTSAGTQRIADPGDAVAPPRDLTALPGHGVERLSDKELCKAWRESFRVLLDAIEPRAKCRVVRLRQTYLEELERRHPDALEAWLASHPRPSAGPEKYLRPAGGDRDAA